MTRPPQAMEADVAVIGAGPAGLTLAIELGRRGISTIVADTLARGAYKSPRTMLHGASPALGHRGSAPL